MASSDVVRSLVIESEPHRVGMSLSPLLGDGTGRRVERGRYLGITTATSPQATCNAG